MATASFVSPESPPPYAAQFAEVLAAETRIRAHIRQTPLERSNYLSDLAEADVYLKLESQQLSGSFKLRGAMNKILSLDEDERAVPVVTASSGNHAAAVARGAVEPNEVDSRADEVRLDQVEQ